MQNLGTMGLQAFGISAKLIATKGLAAVMLCWGFAAFAPGGGVPTHSAFTNLRPADGSATAETAADAGSLVAALQRRLSKRQHAKRGRANAVELFDEPTQRKRRPFRKRLWK